jgi:hypothetical protein
MGGVCCIESEPEGVRCLETIITQQKKLYHNKFDYTKNYIEN